MKDWNTIDLQEDQPISQEDVPEVEEPYYEIERILRWHKVKRKNKILKEYLVLWKGYPVEDAMWVQSSQFSYYNQLQEFLKKINPRKKRLSDGVIIFSKGGVAVGIPTEIHLCTCTNEPSGEDLCTR